MNKLNYSDDVCPNCGSLDVSTSRTGDKECLTCGWEWAD